MSLYTVNSYLRFLFKSTNQHGVHSPFVFNLVTKCFYDNQNHEAYNILARYRNQLIKNKQSVMVEDFGSGSKRFKTEFRKVSDIAKTSGSTLKKAYFLHRLCLYFKPKTILELGTSLGIGTTALAIGDKNSQVATIEGSKELANLSGEYLRDFNISNVNIINKPFSQALSNLKPHSWDFIFIDGHHDQTATIDYFEILLASAHNDTVIIFDDIYWSKGMTTAWNFIKNHPNITVSIDVFYFGIVFLRRELTKEHFYIRL